MMSIGPGRRGMGKKKGQQAEGIGGKGMRKGSLKRQYAKAM